MVRKGGLEPPWAAPLEPKSSASTNSATFAAAFAKRVMYSGFRAGTPGKRPAAAAPLPTKCSPFGALRQISRVRRPLRKLSRRLAARADGAAPGRRARSTASRARPTTSPTKATLPPAARLAALDRYERALDAIAAGDAAGRAALSRARRRDRAPRPAARAVPRSAVRVPAGRARRTRYATLRRSARLLPPLRQSRSAG